ncbi:hypothetical protein [Micromonospora sp. URMC 105]|uniref:hypothetical protein n=1 Tax=Micromonospora sp. URMC 105 TaxID=3423413 RepID=UPI003F5377BC
MIFRNRPLARLGAAALLASGAFTVLGTPAYADNPANDLSLDVAGTRVAAGTEGKAAFVKLSNKGESTPTEVTLTVDVSKLDPAQGGGRPAARRVRGGHGRGTAHLAVPAGRARDPDAGRDPRAAGVPLQGHRRDQG